MSVVVLSMALAATHEIDPAGAQSALTVGDGQYQIESTIIGLNRTGVTGLMGLKKNLTLGITTLRIGAGDDLEYQVAFNGLSSTMNAPVNPRRSTASTTPSWR